MLGGRDGQLSLRTSESGRTRIATLIGAHGQAGTTAVSGSFSIAFANARQPVSASTMNGALAHLLVEFGANVAGVDHAHRDRAAPRQLGAQALGQHRQARLTGRVGRHRAAHPAKRADRGHHHQMPVLLGAEDRHRRLDLRQSGDEIRLQGGEVVLESTRPQRFALADAGVDDHSVHSTQIGGEGVEHFVHRGMVVHIQGPHEHPASGVCRGQLRGQGLEAIGAASTQRQGRAAGGEFAREAHPQSGTGAGDQDLRPLHQRTPRTSLLSIAQNLHY